MKNRLEIKISNYFKTNNNVSNNNSTISSTNYSINKQKAYLASCNH